MKLMRMLFPCGLALVLILSGCGAPGLARSVPAASPTPVDTVGCRNAYYPVATGASWSYASRNGSQPGDDLFTRTIDAATSSDFTVTDRHAAGGMWMVKWLCHAGNLTALDPGAGRASLTTSNAAQSGADVTADGYVVPATFAGASPWSQKLTLQSPVQSNGKSVASSRIDATLQCSLGAAASISVPAGTFQAVSAACTKTVIVSAVAPGGTVQLGATQQSITYWYARGVGLVKSVATGGPANETLLLTSYHIP